MFGNFYISFYIFNASPQKQYCVAIFTESRSWSGYKSFFAQSQPGSIPRLFWAKYGNNVKVEKIEYFGSKNNLYSLSSFKENRHTPSISPSAHTRAVHYIEVLDLFPCFRDYFFSSGPLFEFWINLHLHETLIERQIVLSISQKPQKPQKLYLTGKILFFSHQLFK